MLFSAFSLLQKLIATMKATTSEIKSLPVNLQNSFLTQAHSMEVDLPAQQPAVVPSPPELQGPQVQILRREEIRGRRPRPPDRHTDQLRTAHGAPVRHVRPKGYRRKSPAVQLHRCLEGALGGRLLKIGPVQRTAESSEE